MRARATMLFASAALITATAVAAPAAHGTEATTAPETFLVLGVQSRGGGQFVTLRCDPASGTHPHPEAACKALGEAGGDIDKVSGRRDTLCPVSYDPVVATASGNYQGVPVIFLHAFANRCELASKTAPVFEF